MTTEWKCPNGHGQFNSETVKIVTGQAVVGNRTIQQEQCSECGAVCDPVFA